MLLDSPGDCRDEDGRVAFLRSHITQQASLLRIGEIQDGPLTKALQDVDGRRIALPTATVC